MYHSDDRIDGLTHPNPGVIPLRGRYASAWSSIRKGNRLGDLYVRDAYGW